MGRKTSDHLGIKLNPTDKAILDELQEGRGAPNHLARETGYSRQNITNRLTRLVEHDVVEKLAPGLYEYNGGNRDGGHTLLGDDLDWEKLGPVQAHSADRLEYVIRTLEDSDELADGLYWQTKVVDEDRQSLTVEEVLGGLGEAKHLLEDAKEDLRE